MNLNYRPLLIYGVLLLGSALMSCNKPAGEQDDAGHTVSTSTPPTATTPPAAASASGMDAAGAATAGATAADVAANAESDAAPAPTLDGEKIYAKASCAMCHGKRQEGGTLAPKLAGLSANWDMAKLAAYLKDPVGYAEQDPRLKAQKEQYTMNMPPWSQTRLSDAELAALVDWLLTK